MENTNNFIHRVYGWMGLGLIITALIAAIVGNTPSLISIFLENLFAFYGLLIVELLTVIYLSRAIKNISPATANTVFIAYAALNGLTLSVIFLAYTATSIGSVFLTSAGMFALVGAYGFYTKKDLTTVGNLAFMGLIGVLLASIINIFVWSDRASLIISYISVAVFVGLTAYDTQKLKAFSENNDPNTDMAKKASIMGALTLYLDFINLFLNLLKILGGKKK